MSNSQNHQTRKSNEELENLIDSENDSFTRLSYFKELLEQIKPTKYYYKYIENFLISDTNYDIKILCIDYLIKYYPKKCNLPINYIFKTEFDFLIEFFIKNHIQLINKIKDYLSDEFLKFLFSKYSVLCENKFCPSSKYNLRENIIRNDDFTIEITDLDLKLSRSELLNKFNMRDVPELYKITTTNQIVIYREFNSENSTGIYYTIPLTTFKLISELMNLKNLEFKFLKHTKYDNTYCLIGNSIHSKLSILIAPDISEYFETPYQKIALEKVDRFL